jgi:hypothetical protein
MEMTAFFQRFNQTFDCKHVPLNSPAFVPYKCQPDQDTGWCDRTESSRQSFGLIVDRLNADKRTAYSVQDVLVRHQSAVRSWAFKADNLNFVFDTKLLGIQMLLYKINKDTNVFAAVVEMHLDMLCLGVKACKCVRMHKDEQHNQTYHLELDMPLLLACLELADAYRANTVAPKAAVQQRAEAYIKTNFL